MRFQKDFGHELELTTPADTDLDYYRFVSMKNDNLGLATAEDPVLGVTQPSVQDYKKNSDGTSVLRTKYLKGEIPHIVYEGTCYVETEADTLKVRDRLMLGADGKVKKHEPTTNNAENAYKSILAIVGTVIDVKKIKGTPKLVKVHLKI